MIDVGSSGCPNAHSIGKESMPRRTKGLIVSITCNALSRSAEAAQACDVSLSRALRLPHHGRQEPVGDGVVKATGDLVEDDDADGRRSEGHEIGIDEHFAGVIKRGKQRQ